MATWYEDETGGRAETMGGLTDHGRLALFGPFGDAGAGPSPMTASRVSPGWSVTAGLSQARTLSPGGNMLQKFFDWIVGTVLAPINGAKTYLGIAAIVVSYATADLGPFLTANFPTLAHPVAVATSWLLKVGAVLAAVGFRHAISKGPDAPSAS